jgi:hypothetical protein
MMFKSVHFNYSGGFSGSAKRLSFAASAMSVLGFGFLASSFGDIDTAYVPFVVNVAATVSAVPAGEAVEPIFIDVEAGVEKILKIPVVTASTKMRSQLNNAPVMSNARGKVSLNLPASSYKNADVALYSMNGRTVMRAKATASEAVKSVSRSNVGTGVYLLSVKGTNGCFSSRITHRGGALNIKIAFNGAGALKNTAGKEIKAGAEDVFEYDIKVSADGYNDSVYTLTVVIGDNERQDITLKPEASGNSFTDTRDGKTYKTVTIGSQTWLAENLNYETASGSYCYKDSTKYAIHTVDFIRGQRL